MNQRTRPHVVVVGGGYAGLLAAARVARHGVARVTLVDRRAEFVQRIRLHELLAGSDIARFAYAPALARRGIAFAQGSAEGVDTARQEIRLSANGSLRRLGYDTLIVAAGSTTAAGVPGAVEHTLRLDDPATVARASEALRETAARRGSALIVGGGLTAVETAAELAERLCGLSVILATSGRCAAGYSAVGEAYLRKRLGALRVSIHEGQRVTGVEPQRAWLASGDTIDFDVCVWAGGFTASPLLRNAGLAMDEHGRAIVTPTLQAQGNPTLFVAGDSAAVGDRSATIRMGCVSAMPMGVQAGENVAALLRGAEPHPHSFGFPGRCVSLGRSAGLIQMTDRRDQPVEWIISGLGGAVVKELICRMTMETLRGELATGLPLYRWMGGSDWSAQPATAA